MMNRSFRHASLIGFWVVGLGSTPSLAADVASFDNGDRIIVPFKWKIEHRGKSPIDIAIHQLGTKEGRGLLATIAVAVGVDPTTATIVTANIPLPSINYKETDNKGLIPAPAGMTICSAKPIGKLEASHASWSSTIVRNNKQNGLAYYTSVGTSPGQTHRVMGDFFVEFVKATEGWEKKYNCQPSGPVWNFKDRFWP